MMEEDFRLLATLVRQLADAVLAQARKLEELQRRVQQLEYERTTNAVGKTYVQD